MTKAGPVGIICVMQCPTHDPKVHDAQPHSSLGREILGHATRLQLPLWTDSKPFQRKTLTTCRRLSRPNLTTNSQRWVHWDGGKDRLNCIPLLKASHYKLATSYGLNPQEAEGCPKVASSRSMGWPSTCMENSRYNREGCARPRSTHPLNIGLDN